MSDPLGKLRWAYSPADQRWHVLPEGGHGPQARCGQSLPSGGESHPEPSGLRCPTCEATFRGVVDPTAQRGRLWVPCHRLDTGTPLTLMVSHEWDAAAWTIHAPAAVHLDATGMVLVCQAVLNRARQVLTRAGQGDTP